MIGDIQRCTATASERIELGQGAIRNFYDSTVDMQTVALGIGQLAVLKAGVGIADLYGIALSIMYHTLLHHQSVAGRIDSCRIAN